MTSVQAEIRIKNGLNKRDSKDYQNIPPWQIEEAVNVAAINFVRIRTDVKETSTKLVDDLQILLKSTRLAGSNKDVYFLSHKLPADYIGHSRVTPICEKGSCSNVRLVSDLVEDVNVDELLNDWSSQPSFDFEQTFHTINGNKIKQYHNKDFEVKEIELSYYRVPQYITFPGTPQVNGGIGKDMTWEWKKDVANIIIEDAISILAGDIEQINRFQIAEKNKQVTK